jgi:hypothetical protein
MNDTILILIIVVLALICIVLVFLSYSYSFKRKNKDNVNYSHVESIREKKDLSTVELNRFLVVILNLGIFGTIIRYIANCLEFHTTSLLLGTPNYIIFYIAYFIFAVIHITGIVIILRKKSIIGFYIIVCCFLLSTVSFLVINRIYSVNIFDAIKDIVRNFLSLFILSLLLLLRKNGVSAYKVLMNNKKLKS